MSREETLGGRRSTEWEKENYHKTREKVEHYKKIYH